MSSGFDHNAFYDKILQPDLDVEACAAELWEHQRDHNPIMRRYCELIGDTEQNYMPISFFKQSGMRSGDDWEAEVNFASSGTTGQIPSIHQVRDLNWYQRCSLEAFHHFYAEKKYQILALLPSYLERNNSSLVYMVKYFMETMGEEGSGFFLNDFKALRKAIDESEKPLLLIGVAFAWLDFAEQFPGKMPEGTILMETGGMKGRREALTRMDLHQQLKEAFSLDEIHSEYGMTELLSQAYALKDGRFRCPPWMKVFISDPHLSTIPRATGHSGRINIIDLANVHSCAFIETDDVGRMYEDGSFEVLGRLDAAELRGCSLMYV